MIDVTVKLPAGAAPPVLPEDGAVEVTVTGVTLVVISGDGGSGGGVEMTQASPSASWSFSVPPGFARRPNVAIYDATGDAVLADVEANSSTVNISFPSPVTGSAVLT